MIAASQAVGRKPRVPGPGFSIDYVRVAMYFGYIVFRSNEKRSAAPVKIERLVARRKSADK